MGHHPIPGEGNSLIKMIGGELVAPLGLKKAVLVPLILRRSSAGAFAVPFRVLSRKNVTQRR